MSVEGAGLSLAAGLISVGFTALVFNQYLSRRKPYQLAWSIGLGMYAVAALTQFWAEAYGWDAGIYKLYYLVAAPLVAVLGVGSTLLVHRRAGLGFAVYTAFLFVGFVIAIAGATVNAAFLSAPIPAGEAMPSSVRIWSPLFTVPGSIALIGIALYSFWRTRLRFNLWIGVGAAVVASGGTLARFNLPAALYAAELLGIALMFWGFLASQDLAKVPRAVRAESPSS